MNNARRRFWLCLLLLLVTAAWLSRPQPPPPLRPDPLEPVFHDLLKRPPSRASVRTMDSQHPIYLWAKSWAPVGLQREIYLWTGERVTQVNGRQITPQIAEQLRLAIVQFPGLIPDLQPLFPELHLETNPANGPPSFDLSVGFAIRKLSEAEFRSFLQQTRPRWPSSWDDADTFQVWADCLRFIRHPTVTLARRLERIGTGTSVGRALPRLPPPGHRSRRIQSDAMSAGFAGPAGCQRGHPFSVPVCQALPATQPGLPSVAERGDSPFPTVAGETRGRELLAAPHLLE